MQHNHEYKYKNILLRPLQQSEIELLRIWRNDTKNTKFLSNVPYITKEMQEIWYQNYLNNMDEMTFAIVEDSVLHRTVGSLSLLHPEQERIEVGRIMVGDNEAHGLKVGANATRAAVMIAFSELRKDSVVLHVYEENRAAVKAYTEAGFEVLERTVLDDGRVELIMQIEKEDMQMNVRKNGGIAYKLNPFTYLAFPVARPAGRCAV